MIPDRPATAATPRGESRITNGKSLIFGDSRSAGARRLRDMVRALGLEVCPGGFAQLAPSSQQIVRRIAQLSVELEIFESQRAGGEVIDGLTYLSHCNAHRRAMGDFQKLKHSFAAPKTGRAKTPGKRPSAKRRDALDAFSFGENP